MFRLDKRKIFLLYRYYLLDNVTKIENEYDEERIIWLNKFNTKKKYLEERIGVNLKRTFTFSCLPPLEKAILTYSGYEMLFNQNFGYERMIIDQTINFSKAYLEEEKYKYINKVLDLLLNKKKL
ncbi:transcription antitermination factor NusB [endosymbiont GvMRE of Glomus versiforme]|uniref:transcription antitermination factor NusB n=1 Tax=endosymbiont GvMRE of Glomus versiforme TaxID=2039283 RepID=UPI000ED24B7D|nr:transcription antitermination factor NusB [endosymbiont GvMRE of Glomus versiforme]RHZ35664.1 Transcription antitermination protein NusB [endosymbiont GvMRE of Glomus versiforme]